MSTFNGIIDEFPDIRIDYFRNISRAPPLACFLSHVHSDHLAGLETLKSPFVYCSAATREILLRLERYPCRINYAKGCLEARVQTYKHLKNIVKSLPLETQITLELAPGNHIRITLFDANHCTGAVMFLIEGQGRAVLYTGDMRSEPWFINSIARNPHLTQYTTPHQLKVLDKIYLDTSFLEDVTFQTKAEGIDELLRKVAAYPDETIFHIHAWTYGYENVWIALSRALNSRIHVDDYKLRTYGSLTTRASTDRFGLQIHHCAEAPALTGFMCGNTFHPGCLTDHVNVRLHSCEKGNHCHIIQSTSVVNIKPVVAHLRDGSDWVEAGIGGGGEDLNKVTELEGLDSADMDSLLKMVYANKGLSEDAQGMVSRLLETAAATGRNIMLSLGNSAIDSDGDVEINTMLESIAQKSRSVTAVAEGMQNSESKEKQGQEAAPLPRVITFPYARHSSYPELRAFVARFSPKDVWPCTEHARQWRLQNMSIKSLFGDLCHPQTEEFAYDRMVLGEDFRETLDSQQQTQLSSSQEEIAIADINSQLRALVDPQSGACYQSQISSASETVATDGGIQDYAEKTEQRTRDGSDAGDDEYVRDRNTSDAKHSTGPLSNTGTIKRDYEEFSESQGHSTQSDSQQSLCQRLSTRDSPLRIDAYRAMLENVRNGKRERISLLSTTASHRDMEPRLGER